MRNQRWCDDVVRMTHDLSMAPASGPIACPPRQSLRLPSRLSAPALFARFGLQLVSIRFGSQRAPLAQFVSARSVLTDSVYSRELPAFLKIERER